MPLDFVIPRAGGGPSHFRLSEWPCWERYTRAQVDGVVEAVQVHLQPVRDAWGPLQITSGQYWSSGCTPRTGAHAIAGTVDYVPLRANMADVFAWASSYARSSFGTLIFERNHIHRTPPGAQDRWGQVYTEPVEGEYVALEPYGPSSGFPGGWGSPERPFRDPRAR